MTNTVQEDIAYGIVEDYLAEGPEYMAIVEAVNDEYDEDADDDDYEEVALIVRRTLNYLAQHFNIQ